MVKKTSTININTFMEERFCDKCEKNTPHEVLYCCDEFGKKLKQYSWKASRCICGHIRENRFWNKETKFKLEAEQRVSIAIKF